MLSGHLELFFFQWMCYKNAIDELSRKKKRKTNQQLKVSLSGFNNSWKGDKLLHFLKSYFLYMCDCIKDITQ